MRFTKFLAMILLVTQVGINSTWAEETVGTENQYSGLPTIHFYLSEENFLLIDVSGLLIQDTQGFTWNGIDISELMQQYQQNGIIELSEKTDGFGLKVNVDVETLGESNEFGILFARDNKLSSVFRTKDLLAENSSKAGLNDKMSISGKVSYRDPSCFFWKCWKPLAGVTVSIKFGPVVIGSRDTNPATTGANGEYQIYTGGCGNFTVTANYNGKPGSLSVTVEDCLNLNPNQIIQKIANIGIK